jgi:hypothetical protein
MTRRFLLGCAAVVLGILAFQPIRSSSFWTFTRMPTPSEQARIDEIRRGELNKAITQNPQIAGPMATYRVREEKKEYGTVHRGAGYVAETTARGLHFEVDGRSYIDLAAAKLEQGEKTFDLATGTVSSPAFGDVRVDRGPLVEQYIFENSRTEQIFRIPQPLGSGELRVSVSVKTDLTGPVTQRKRGEGGWTDTALQDGGVAFSDPRGVRKVAYHGAVAMDAAGRHVDLDPSYSPGQIALAVPADFMAQAVYPVAIDPWLELNFSASGGGMSLGTGVSQTPAVAVIGGGNPYVTWSEQVTSNGGLNYEIFFRYWNGNSWVALGASDTQGGISNNAGNSINPSIAIGNAGTIYIAWQDDTGGTQEVLLRKWDNTGTWDELSSTTPIAGQTITSASPTGGLSLGIGSFSGFPSVAATTVAIPSTGAVHDVPVIAYESTNPGPDSIIVCAWFPGDPGVAEVDNPSTGAIISPAFPVIPMGFYALGFGPNSGFYTGAQMSLTPATAVSQKPTLKVPMGTFNAVVGWQDTRNNTHDIMVAHYTPTGFPGGPNQPPFPKSRPPDFAFGTWAGFGTSFPNNGGITVNPTGAGNSNFSINPSLDLDSATGFPTVAWEQVLTPLTSSEIHVLQWNGGGWAALANSNSAGGISNVTATPRISATPSLAMDGSTPWVSWQDNESGNAEIYVRRFVGGVWQPVGFNSSSAGVTALGGTGGISQTTGISLTPSLGINGNASIAWQDDTSGTRQIYLRRFFENAPSLLRQTTPGGVTVVPFGSAVVGTQIELRGFAFSENTSRFVHMQVEVVPVGSPFLGNVTVDSGEVGGTGPAPNGYDANQLSLAEMVCNVPGLVVGVSYQWRARTVDDAGNTSAWVSAGGSDGVVDFATTSVSAVPPSVPTGLSVGLINGIVTLTWTAPVGGADSYNVKRSPVSLLPGLVYPPADIISASGTVVAPTFQDNSTLPGNTYFYVVSAVRGGLESTTNSNEVSITIPTSGLGSSQDQISKHRCGLVGGEAAVLLAAAAFLRRRRRK